MANNDLPAIPSRGMLREALGIAVQYLLAEGIRVYPSAEQMIRSYVNRAYERGTIHNLQEGLFAALVLLAIAAEDAQKQHKFTVSPDNIEEAWEKIALFPGNCPPHICMRRSIIEKHEEYMNKLALLQSLIMRIFERLR